MGSLISICLCIAKSDNCITVGECDIPDNNMRVSCGYAKGEAQCREKNCCWLLSDVHGVAWCYYKQGESKDIILYDQSTSHLKHPVIPTDPVTSVILAITLVLPIH